MEICSDGDRSSIPVRVSADEYVWPVDIRVESVSL